LGSTKHPKAREGPFFLGKLSLFPEHAPETLGKTRPGEEQRTFYGGRFGGIAEKRRCQTGAGSDGKKRGGGGGGQVIPQKKTKNKSRVRASKTVGVGIHLLSILGPHPQRHPKAGTSHSGNRRGIAPERCAYASDRGTPWKIEGTEKGDATLPTASEQSTRKNVIDMRQKDMGKQEGEKKRKVGYINRGGGEGGD